MQFLLGHEDMGKEFGFYCNACQKYGSVLVFYSCCKKLSQILKTMHIYYLKSS